MKKILVFFLIFAMLFSLSSCGKSEVAIADKDGERIYYTGDDLKLKDLSGVEGIFVLNEDNTYSPIVASFYGYKASPSASSPERYLWFTNNAGNVSKLIPTMKKGSKLVMLYNSDDSLPDEFLLEKYAYRGYTIGCHVYRDEDDTMYIETDDALSGSYAQTTIEAVSDEREYRVAAVNESAKLPLSNIDNNLHMLLGLEKGKTYNFSFYKGTKYVTFNTVADTQVFQSERLTSLQNPYSKTKDGYFEINLPDNLENGYYYICELGMFKYER